MKKAKIEGIESTEDLAFLVEKIISNIGFEEVGRPLPYFLTAEENTLLKSKKIYFYVTLSELNGKVHSVLENIKDVDEEITDIYIVSTSRKISKYFKLWIEEELGIKNIDYWSRDELIKIIDKNYEEYWTHDDTFLSDYEKRFLADLKKDVELKKLLKLDDKYNGFLNFFIEPKVFIFREDQETKRPTKQRVNTDTLSKIGNCVISGDAGTGKSTLIKEVGRKLIEQNRAESHRNIPVYIKANDLFEAGFSIWEAVANKFNEFFSGDEITAKLEGYNLVILIDSIDEFETKNRKKIVEDLDTIQDRISRFYIGTRNYDALLDGCILPDHDNAFIVNFDQRQVKNYIDQFFRFDLAKSDALWEVLNENNTLEKIPVTPLTISLISILFEDKGYEIPATITDVYDNFSLFLLGRTTVSSRLDFLDINIKERILSTYALNILLSDNRVKKTKNEFIEFIKSFFERKSISIEEEMIPELLKSLTDGTGILYIDNHNFVSFKHDHFMEYYASVEIFNHHRIEHESTLVENFAEFNWQNTAVFYAGRTKDMASFLRQVIDKCKSYVLLNDCLTGVSGLGHLLQSLWLTDSVERREGVMEALELLIRANEEIQRLSSSKFPFFKDIREPDIAMMNLVWFYKHFNSLVLKDPMQLAYNSLDIRLKEMEGSPFSLDRRTMLFMMFCIASTLNTGRNSSASYLDKLFDEDGILTIPLFVLLFDTGLDVLESINSKHLKDSFKIKNRVKKYIGGIKFYLDNPSESLRLTSLSSFAPIKSIKIYTEGKTDAIIIKRRRINNCRVWQVYGIAKTL